MDDVLIKPREFPEYVRIFNGEWYTVGLKEAVKRVACRVIPCGLSKQTVRACIAVINGIILSCPQGVSVPYEVHQECYEDISAQVDACFPDYVKINTDLEHRRWGDEELFMLCGLDLKEAENMAKRGADSNAIAEHFFGGKITSASIWDKNDTVGFGARGDFVRTVQNRINRISRFYPCINKLKPDGIFGQKTENAVKEFQRIRGIKPDGVVGRCTRIELCYAFDKVTRMSGLTAKREDLNFEKLPVPMSEGEEVEALKRVLALFGEFYPHLTYYVDMMLKEKGYGPMTVECVSRFQGICGILQSGVVSESDRYYIINTYLHILPLLPDAPPQTEGYPGYELYEGCIDVAVQTVGEYLQAISEVFEIPEIEPSEVFTPRMHNAVVQFQLLFMPGRADGVIDLRTWERITDIYSDVKAAKNMTE